MITENQKITDGNATFIVRKMGGGIENRLYLHV